MSAAVEQRLAEIQETMNLERRARGREYVGWGDLRWLLSLVRSLLPVVEAAERARKLIDTYREVLRRRDAGEIIDVANDTPTIRRLDAALHAYRESDK